MLSVTKHSKSASKLLITHKDGDRSRCAPGGLTHSYHWVVLAPDQGLAWAPRPGTAHLGGRRGRGQSPYAGENFHCVRCVLLDSTKNARLFAKNTDGINLKNAGYLRRTGGGGSKGTLEVTAGEMESWVGTRPAEGG